MSVLTLQVRKLRQEKLGIFFFLSFFGRRVLWESNLGPCAFQAGAYATGLYSWAKVRDLPTVEHKDAALGDFTFA